MRTDLLVALSALLLAVTPQGAQESTQLFDLAKTSIDRGSAERFAADLVAYAQTRARAVPDFHIMGDYRKLVRVAYQFSPEGKSVLTAHVRIKSGLAPGPPKAEMSPGELMKALLPLVKKTREGTARDDPAAALYLCAVGLMVDPQNETCLVESELLQKKGGREIVWEQALAVYRRVIPDGATCSVNGLVVMTAGGNAEVGQVSRIVLTYRQLARASINVQFLREEGARSQVAGEEAVRYWDRVRKNVPLPGGTLEISFEDKFSKRDGPSAGAAYAVLLRSFSDPFQGDPAFAMTGDVAVDGRVLPVGGVFAKVRGAAMGRCTRVGIPTGNAGDLIDGIILNGPATLTEIEVYGLETIEDAVALARADKDPRLEQATAHFTGLRPLVEKRMKSAEKARSPEIQKITDTVLALAPRHLSAVLLDGWNNGRLPSKLTLGGSLEEPQNIFYRYLVTISTGEKPLLNDVLQESKPGSINNALKSLKELRPKLHPDAQKSAGKLEEVAAAIQKLIPTRAGLEEREKRVEAIDRRIKDVKLKIEKANAEGRSNEEINQLIKQHNRLVEDHKASIESYKKAIAEREQAFQKVVELYKEYISLIRTLTQDPRMLEKLLHGQ